MSAAKKCDRCGDYYDGYTNYIYKETVSVDEKEVRLTLEYHRPGLGDRLYSVDLCPRCQKSLLDWFSKERYREIAND